MPAEASKKSLPREWVAQRDGWWARQDLNLGPTDYESAALTAELRAPRRVTSNLIYICDQCGDLRQGEPAKVLSPDRQFARKEVLRQEPERPDRFDCLIAVFRIHLPQNAMDMILDRLLREI